MIKNLTVNKLIEIKKDDNSNEQYKSRVEEINNEGIWISSPTLKGNLVLLSVGQEIKLSFGDELSIYYFFSFIKKRVKEPIPMLLIEMPDVKNIFRIQRRDFVRIPAIIPLEFGIITPEFQLDEVKVHKANTVDLSGGGLKFITNIPIKESDLLQVNLLLEENLILFGKAVRVNKYSDENKIGYNSIGIKFININESDRDRVIKFVFDWQRKMRRKGLL